MREVRMRMVPLAVAMLLAGAGGAGAQPTSAREVRPTVVVAGVEGGTARVEVRLERAAGLRLASYQGEVRYPRGAMTLAGAELPAGVVGAWHEVEPGTVRFAAVAPGGMEGATALTLRFTPARAAGPASVRVTLEEVVGAEGFRKLSF